MRYDLLERLMLPEAAIRSAWLHGSRLRMSERRGEIVSARLVEQASLVSEGSFAPFCDNPKKLNALKYWPRYMS